MGKGASFEREMCKYLSLWWTEGKYSDVFWRSRVRSTRKSPDAKHQLGDIKAERSEGQLLVDMFSIELKTGYSKGKKGKTVKNVPWDLLDLIDYRKGSEDLEKKRIIMFWRQTVTDAEISGRKPLLIFKRDFHVPIVCIHESLFQEIEERSCSYKDRYLIFQPDFFTDKHYQDNNDKKDDWLILCRSETFFEWLSPDTIKGWRSI